MAAVVAAGIREGTMNRTMNRRGNETAASFSRRVTKAIIADKSIVSVVFEMGSLCRRCATDYITDGMHAELCTTWSGCYNCPPEPEEGTMPDAANLRSDDVDACHVRALEYNDAISGGYIAGKFDRFGDPLDAPWKSGPVEMLALDYLKADAAEGNARLIMSTREAIADVQDLMASYALALASLREKDAALKSARAVVADLGADRDREHARADRNAEALERASVRLGPSGRALPTDVSWARDILRAALSAHRSARAPK